MSQVSPPKPWERNSAATSPLSAHSIAAAPLPSSMSSLPNALPAPSGTTSSPSSSTGTPPSIPQRPPSLTNSSLTTVANPYSTLNRPGYGMGTTLGGAYGGYGGISSYTSPYSRFGGGMYGGVGGMGGMGSYGGYGMGGMGAYGGFPGNVDPNDPNSFARGMENSTAATFQLIESIVSAFGGFAQMLESTFMATHSSFFAMVRVAEQFGNLKSSLGSILGIFTMLRWARTFVAKVSGRPLPASAGDLTAANFARFEGRRGGNPRPSKKPFFFFVAAVFGLPYLMGKLIRSLASKQEEEEKRRMAELGPQADPSKLEFCRVVYDFTPEQNNGIELEVKKGDLVAVLSKSDPMGNPSQWWRCRARDSRVGYLPSPYLESIVRRDASDGPPVTIQMQIEVEGSRTATMTSQAAKPVVAAGKPGDIGIESFQKSQFNS